MLRNLFIGLAMTATIVLGSASAFAADPTISQVYQAAEEGRYTQAQQMMDQVLRDHPNSGKAHFAESELLAKQGRISGARTELANAERLEPGLPFAKPAAVQELKSLLTTNVSHTATGVPSFTAPAAPVAAQAGLPWGLIIVALLAIALIVYFFNRRPQTVVQTAPDNMRFGGGYNAAPSYGGPVPMAPTAGGMGSGMGSGILGGLATGAAVGAGIVAGEALMHHVLDSNGQPVAAPLSSNDWNNPEQNYDMGGNDFGIADDSSWDDSSGGGSDDSWN